jgi:hypothetical protein
MFFNHSAVLCNNIVPHCIHRFLSGFFHAFPGFALVESFLKGDLSVRGSMWKIPSLLFWLIGLIAFLILLQSGISEIKILKRRCDDFPKKNHIVRILKFWITVKPAMSK